MVRVDLLLAPVLLSARVGLHSSLSPTGFSPLLPFTASLSSVFVPSRSVGLCRGFLVCLVIRPRRSRRWGRLASPLASLLLCLVWSPPFWPLPCRCAAAIWFLSTACLLRLIFPCFFAVAFAARPCGLSPSSRWSRPSSSPPLPSELLAVSTCFLGLAYCWLIIAARFLLLRAGLAVCWCFCGDAWLARLLGLGFALRDLFALTFCRFLWLLAPVRWSVRVLALFPNTCGAFPWLRWPLSAFTLGSLGPLQ